VYVTEVSQKHDFIKFTMYERAKVNPAGIPALVEAYKGTLKFTIDTRPYFIYQPLKNNRKEEKTVLEVVKNVLNDIKSLIDE